VQSPRSALLLAVALFAGSGSGLHAEESWAAHGQLTYVEQDTSDFDAPYRGANSLSPDRGAETVDATLYLGARLWREAELWINPEADQGHGLNDTLGVAGFPSGEAYKVGKNQPYFRVQRAFLRDTISVGGNEVSTEGSANQLAQTESEDRIVLWFGKFSVPDVFDGNQFAHDPRADFFNWTIIDTGTFDYAADAWGYTAGAAVEWYAGHWTLRGGLFDLSDVPNSADLEPAFHEFQMLTEIEHRHELSGAPGRVLVTLFESRGRMGLLDTAVQRAELTGSTPNAASVRKYRSRIGGSLDIEQSLTPALGAFIRLGKAQGNVETYEFTDVDRSAAFGVSIKGADWHRAKDTVGLATVINNASAARQRYLADGGLGILIGDGKLPHPGPEQIIESYYSAQVFSNLNVTLDYQWVDHPAYNRDRGPASLLAFRLHVQF
jgi:high affinity Mn2+ porin